MILIVYLLYTKHLKKSLILNIKYNCYIIPILVWENESEKKVFFNVVVNLFTSF
jgi:hypothetical protein